MVLKRSYIITMLWSIVFIIAGSLQAAARSASSSGSSSSSTSAERKEAVATASAGKRVRGRYYSLALKESSLGLSPTSAGAFPVDEEQEEHETFNKRHRTASDIYHNTAMMSAQDCILAASADGEIDAQQPLASSSSSSSSPDRPSELSEIAPSFTYKSSNGICPYCKKFFKVSGSWYNHVRQYCKLNENRKLNKDKNSCICRADERCGQRFSSKVAQENHEQGFHPEKRHEFTCTTCNFSAPHARTLARHKDVLASAEHRSEVEQVALEQRKIAAEALAIKEKRKKSSELASSSSFSSSSLAPASAPCSLTEVEKAFLVASDCLFAHSQEDGVLSQSQVEQLEGIDIPKKDVASRRVGQKGGSCKYCGTWYTLTDSLRRHEKYHCSKIPSDQIHLFLCQSDLRCGQSFTRDEVRRNHEGDSHDKQHLYRCKICSFSSPQKTGLKNHSRLASVEHRIEPEQATSGQKNVAKEALAVKNKNKASKELASSSSSSPSSSSLSLVSATRVACAARAIELGAPLASSSSSSLARRRHRVVLHHSVQALFLHDEAKELPEEEIPK